MKNTNPIYTGRNMFPLDYSLCKFQLCSTGKQAGMFVPDVGISAFSATYPVFIGPSGGCSVSPSGTVSSERGLFQELS